MANNNENKILNVPHLRFRGFTDEWNMHKLNQLVERVTRKNKGEESKIALTISAQYGLVDQETFFNNKVASSDLSHYYLLVKGDYAYNKSYSSGYPWGAVKRLNLYEKGAVSTLYICFRPFNTVDSDYIGHYFESKKWHKEVSEIAVEGARNHGLLNISVKDFFETLHFVPSITEQKKIAALLTLIDERIATQNKIIDKLKSLIKGLNDKIHKDIKGEIVCFADLGEAYAGLSGKSGDDFGTGEPFITYMNVYQNTYISEIDYEFVQIAPNERQNCVQYGDALFTLSSETPEEVGMGAVYLGNTQKLYLNSFCFGIHIYDERVLPRYLAHFISSTSFRKAIYPLAQGSTRFNLQRNDFMKMRFVLPTTEEQERIAKTFDALHCRLANEMSLVEQCLVLKQYLLSQMFI